MKKPAKKKPSKTRDKRYESKLSIEGSFEDVLKVSIAQAKKKEKK